MDPNQQQAGEPSNSAKQHGFQMPDFSGANHADLVEYIRQLMEQLQAQSAAHAESQNGPPLQQTPQRTESETLEDLMEQDLPPCVATVSVAKRAKIPIHDPPVFKERMKNEEVDNWVTQIENWIGLQESFNFERPLTDLEKNRLVSSFLEGDPFEFWRQDLATSTFAGQIAIFRNRYTDLDWMEIKKRHFEKMRQTTSARAFVRELQTLARKLDPVPSPESIIRRFRDGLREDVRNALDIQLCMPANTSPDDYVMRAIAFDEVQFRQRRQNRDESLNATVESLNAMNERKKGKGSGKNASKGKGKRDPLKVTRYACNKPGHYANECRSKNK
ncbi:hypothetical protein KCV03_g9823, partial [Aureobasidium melanogenum]